MMSSHGCPVWLWNGIRRDVGVDVSVEWKLRPLQCLAINKEEILTFNKYLDDIRTIKTLHRVNIF